MVKAIIKKQKLESTKAKAKPTKATPAAEPCDSPATNDDLDRAIVDCVTRRLRSTVRIRPLPNRCRLADLYALCPSAVAARLPWNRARCRHKGVAFLEFSSPEAAAKHAKALQGSRALGGARELATSIPPVEPGSISASQYSQRRVVISSLEGRVAASQLLELAPGAQRVQFPEAGAGAGRGGRHAPGVAVLTFADARQALAAVTSCQGAAVAGGKTSWMLEKIGGRPKPKHLIDRRTLVLTGVTKSATDSRLLLALPRCSKLERRPSGVAVATYETEAGCAADLAAFPSAWPGSNADDEPMPTVAYGHRKPLKLAAESAGSRSVQPRTRLIVAGLPQATKKSTLANFLADRGVKANRVTLSSNGQLALINFDSELMAAKARVKLLRSWPVSDSKLRVAYSLDKLAVHSKKAKLASRTRKVAPVKTDASKS